MKPMSVATWIVPACLLAALSCFGDQPVAKQTMLRDIARNVIVPEYRDLAEKCRTLTAAADQLAKAPAADALERTRQAWRAVLLASSQVRWLQTGPVADREYLSAFYYSKIVPMRIEEALQSARAFDDTYLEEIGPTTKGVFALEYLLFRPQSASSQQDPVAAATDVDVLLGTNVQRHCQYILALAEELQKKAQTLSEDWSGADSTGAFQTFVAGGQSTLNGLVNQMAQIVENVAENHLNFALNLPAPVMQQVNRIEGGRSGSSVSELVAILRGVQKAYRGGEGVGIDDYLRGLNAPLDTKLEQQFQKALAALENITMPIQQAVTDQKTSVQAAYETVRTLEILLKVDLASALGITITFTSGDGD